MQERKKIISTVLKVLIGFGCCFIIYWRLKSDFTLDKLQILSSNVLSLKGIVCLSICLLLIPVNWGIEAFKWKLITAPIEKISFTTASHSVYSGICVGNLAPGRATEFLAKIIFFKVENRPTITAIHFIHGMFQLSITYIFGLTVLSIKIKQFDESNVWLAYTATAIAVFVFSLFIFCIFKIDFILNLISKKISKQTAISNIKYSFTGKILIQLFSLSILRYVIFSCQFLILIYLFHNQDISHSILIGIALYYLITTTIPMISILEAPIRAAVALVVFHNSNISESALALSSVLIWLINIILPSIYGYSILLKQNFNFNLFSKK